MESQEIIQRNFKRDEGFDRTFASWKQTHFLIVTHVVTIADEDSEILSETRLDGGMFAVADLCSQLTDVFEEKYKDEHWEDKDYIDTLESFVEKTLNVVRQPVK